MSSSQRLRSPVLSSSLNEKSVSSDQTPVSQTSSSIRPAVPAATIYKLLFFTFAMFSFPLLAYFSTRNLIFGGNSTYAGALAAVVANLVLFGYIIVAVREDQGEERQGRKGGKIE